MSRERQVEHSTVAVLFVCLGNICRSPTAHGVFAQRVENSALADRIIIDSCGTGDWHIGREPDRRAIAAAKSGGYDLSALRARQVQRSDFAAFDYILAMDSQNLRDLQAMCPKDYQGRLALFLDFASDSSGDVPDPYYGGDDGFGQVLAMVEDASAGLLQDIERALQR